jgi:hypothetical protein
MAENRQKYTSRVAPGLSAPPEVGDLAIQAEQAEQLQPLNEFNG